MERKEFVTKLLRSLLIITAVVALSHAFSDLSKSSSTSCPSSDNCKACQKEASCIKKQTPVHE